MKRRKMNRKESKRVFKAGAVNVKAKNLAATPMRGGFRL